MIGNKPVYLLTHNISGDFGDRLWFAIHLVAAQIMLLSSVAYHTLSCNTGICMHVAKLDYSGKFDLTRWSRVTDLDPLNRMMPSY